MGKKGIHTHYNRSESINSIHVICDGAIFVISTCTDECGKFSDINECSKGTFNCTVNSTCVNTAGSYKCECNSGYSSTGGLCQGKFLILPCYDNQFWFRQTANLPSIDWQKTVTQDGCSWNDIHLCYLLLSWFHPQCCWIAITIGELCSIHYKIHSPERQS